MSYEGMSREELEEALDAMEQELIDLESKAKRIKADFENYKRKQDERKQRWQNEAEKQLAKDLISVLDNLERAIMSADDENSTLLKGVEMVADELYNTLNQRGLERITPDDDFDPAYHTAVDTQEHDEDNTILETRRHGYMFGDHILREAEVVVGKTDTENNGTENTSTSEN